MIANYVCCHTDCMNAFKAATPKKESMTSIRFHNTCMRLSNLKLQLSVSSSPLFKSYFVARQPDGSHNAVSHDMLLEQTYNADVKDSSGLDSITS